MAGKAEWRRRRKGQEQRSARQREVRIIYHSELSKDVTLELPPPLLWLYVEQVVTEDKQRSLSSSIQVPLKLL